VQQNSARSRAFARPRRWRTQPALKVARILIGISHEMAAAFAALGAAQHVVVDKLHQAPGARDGQQRLLVNSFQVLRQHEVSQVGIADSGARPGFFRWGGVEVRLPAVRRRMCRTHPVSSREIESTQDSNHDPL